jgi:transcriptional regulator with XRE-family HTH domain
MNRVSHGSAADDRSAAKLFGSELGRLRMSRGLSLRRLARIVGIAAHSALVDYERGIRIPPDDLLASLIAALHPETDRLATLYRDAIAERARRAPEANSGCPWSQYDQARPGPTAARASRCSRCGPTIDMLADALEWIARQLRDIDESSGDHVSGFDAGPTVGLVRAD